MKGFCCEQNYKLLIYELVSGGSADKWLFDPGSRSNEPHWQDRIDIALGVARALAYLHLECQTCVAHGNLKLDNVMLDQNLVPKLMDFGLEGLLQGDSASSSESASERDIYSFRRLKRDPPQDEDVKPFDQRNTGSTEIGWSRGVQESIMSSKNSSWVCAKSTVS